MNDALENEIEGTKLPSGTPIENLSWEEKQARLNENQPATEGEPAPTTPEPDMTDIPGEKIEYPRIEETQESKETPIVEPAINTNVSVPEPAPVSESIIEPVLERVPVSREAIIKKTNEWYRSQDEATKQNLFAEFVDIGNAGTGILRERQEGLVKKFSGNVKKESGAEILARLSGENIPEPHPEQKPEQNFDFNQSKVPSRRGFEPIVIPSKPKASDLILEPDIAQEASAPEANPTEERIIDDPTVLLHEVRQGESLNEILDNILKAA